MKIKLTNSGVALLKRTLAGETTLTFTKLKLGNGTNWSETDAVEATELRNLLLEVPFSAAEVTENGEYVNLSAIFNNNEIEVGFHITELGFFAKDSDEVEFLYALGITSENNADYVPGKEERVLEFELGGMIFISDSENVSAVLNDSLTSVSVKDFRDHIEDYQNPHKTNKYHVGLGNIENYAISDQMPKFEESEILTNIESGSRMAILFGVIKKAISSLIKHLSDTDNPHEVTKEKLGAADVKHSHSTTDIKSGVLSVVRGGTGNNSIEKNAVLVGDNTDPVKAVKGIGAFFSDGGGAPKFNTLPVNMGGTGLTKGASFVSESELIEGSYGCYGSVVLPGGLLIQWGRLYIPYGAGQSPKIEFEKSFADTNYALIFTTSSGHEQDPASMPKWSVPTKEKDYFYMYHPFGYVNSVFAAHVADWVAFGRAADN